MKSRTPLPFRVLRLTRVSRSGSRSTSNSRTSHEADLSAQSDPAKANPWLPRPHEDPRRPDDPQASTSKGSKAPGGDDALEVGVSVPTGRFSSKDRLRRSREFKQVTRRGRRAAASAYVVLTAPGIPGRGPRLGLTVSRKVGNAVVRNRVKRRIREWFRASRATWPGAWDIVVIARREAAEIEYDRGAELLSRLVAEGIAR